MRKCNTILVLLLLGFFANNCIAQPYLTNKGKYRFAQGAMGIDFLYIPQNGQSTIIDSNGNYTYKFGGNFIPRIVIGGTHFWGHLDFAINYPVGKFGGKKDSLSSNNQFDIITAKYYPWAIQKNKMRPYIGTACNVNIFRQAGGNKYYQYWSGSDFYLSMPINIGTSYQLGSFLFSADAKFNIINDRKLYANRTDVITYKLPSYGLSFGVKKIFEGTVKPFEKKYEDGTMEKEYQATKKKLNAFSFGLGLSSSFYTGQSEFNKTNRPYLSKNLMATFIPEFAVGYYLDKQDVHFNIAYRNIVAGTSGFGMLQKYQRKVITLEAYKFFWDYKGFVPFAGIGIGRENLSFRETDAINGMERDLANKQFSPSIICGWDIRYHRNYYFMLRTNIRYSPFLKLDTKGSLGKLNMSQLEVNFIQAVFYPQRLMAKMKAKKMEKK
jgi:outer membrane protein W